MAMTVKELRAELEELEDDLLVVLAKDEEGNGYSPLAEGDLGRYVADSTWSGEFFGESIVGNDEYDQPPGDEREVRAYCLWPVN